MGEVYRDAAQVDVWLGVGDPNVSYYMDDVKKPRQVELDTDFCRAYDAFHGLPYWERAWVVQEIYFVQRLRYMYGTRCAMMEEMDKAEVTPVFLAYTWSAEKRGGMTPGNFKSTKNTMECAHDLSFIGMSWMLNQKCRRIHDGIYAFQSLILAETSMEVNYEWTPLQLFNALVDNLAEHADDNGFSDIEVYANRLDILPEDYSWTLRRLNGSVEDGLDEEDLHQWERCYKTWTPRVNPACRGNETWARRIFLEAQDKWGLLQGKEPKPSYPGFMFWSGRYEANDE
ncbi:Fc.00g093540.m01.CDS01 [Cosmosporella sp. VM-42]